MKIIGFNINKIQADKKGNFSNKCSIKSGINIKDITSEKINISENPSLKFDFEFNLDYEPDLALILISGTVIILDDSNEGPEILKDWKKNKFDHEIKLPIYNFIMGKCNLKSLNLEEELGIPFHIPFPKLTPNKEESKKDKSNPTSYTG